MVLGFAMSHGTRHSAESVCCRPRSLVKTVERLDHLPWRFDTNAGEGEEEEDDEDDDEDDEDEGGGEPFLASPSDHRCAATAALMSPGLTLSGMVSV